MLKSVEVQTAQIYFDNKDIGSYILSWESHESHIIIKGCVSSWPMLPHTAFSPKCFSACVCWMPSKSFRHGANRRFPVASLCTVPQATMIQSSVTKIEKICPGLRIRLYDNQDLVLRLHTASHCLSKECSLEYLLYQAHQRTSMAFLSLVSSLKR